MVSKLLKMQLLEDDEELAYSPGDSEAKEEKAADGRPSWMRQLHTSIATWLHMVPKVRSNTFNTVDHLIMFDHYMLLLHFITIIRC